MQNRSSLPSRSPRAHVVRGRVAVVAALPLKVVVTGAAGRTGGLITKKLVDRPQQFEARAVVRGEQSKAKVVGLGVPESNVFLADVGAGGPAALAQAFAGADALVIATSGVPVLKPLSLFKVFWAKFTGQKGVLPDFSWKEGQRPEQIDWLGQKAQVDAAKSAGIKHVVVIGSMGGTQGMENNLNTLGDDGMILMWKRKAEEYLIASGLPYTIIHPGGLLNDKGGEMQVLLDVDDKFLKRERKAIPREDVAELAVQCLTLPEAKNRSFDCIAVKPESGTAPPLDAAALLATLQGANCDYSRHSDVYAKVVAKAT